VPPVLETYVLPVAAAILAGGLIGLEREHRGHPAGLRTHILVALASALLMLSAVHQMEWFASDTPIEVVQIDPVRMAHGILTGIGFLCGGVIFRQGLSVHGLTTAASLWTTSALGTLYGVGAYGIATGGALATLVVLILLRWVDARLPQGALIGVTVRYRREGEFPERRFRELLCDLGLKPRTVSHRFDAADDVVSLSATVRGAGEGRSEDLARRLCDDPRVTAFELRARDD
jgi:putative Mg2+ transporter-C (MgtC) family protein